MSSHIDVNRENFHEACRVLAEVDLQTSWRYSTGIGSSAKAVSLFLNTMRHHDQFFTSQEKRIIAGELQHFTRKDQVSMINRNLLFLASSEGDTDVRERIQFVRENLALENTSGFDIQVPKESWSAEAIKAEYDVYRSNLPDYKTYTSGGGHPEIFDYLRSLRKERFGHSDFEPVLVFMFSWFKHSHPKELEIVYNHFEAYLEDLVKQKKLIKDPETGFLKIDSPSKMLSICIDFMLAFQNKETRSIKGKHVEIAPKKTVAKEIAGKEKEEVPHFAIEQQGHRDEASYKKLQAESKPSAEQNNPIVEKARKQISYLNRLRWWYRTEDRKPEALEYSPRYEGGRPILDKEGKQVYDPLSDEEIAYHKWANGEIRKIQEEQNISLKEAAEQFFAKVIDDLKELDAPSAFYGDGLPSSSLYESTKLKVAKKSFIDQDEAWLRKRYDELRGGKQKLSEEELKQLENELAELEKQSQAIVEKERKYYNILTQRFALDFIPTLIMLKRFPVVERVKSEADIPEGYLYEIAKSMAKGNIIFVSLDLRREQIENDLSLPREEKERLLSQLTEERRILEDILSQILVQLRVTNDPAAILTRTQTQLRGLEYLTNNIELPIYFPDRLKIYLREYHRLQ